jgi:hypothetical protein
MISKLSRDLPFSRNQPLKLVDDLIKLQKQEDRTLRLSLGTCSYVCMYINAVADSVMLYLQHDFYNIIFKIKHKLYIALGSAPTPQQKRLGAQLVPRWILDLRGSPYAGLCIYQNN